MSWKNKIKKIEKKKKLKFSDLTEEQKQFLRDARQFEKDFKKLFPEIKWKKRTKGE
jgi:hypothetical protein